MALVASAPNPLENAVDLLNAAANLAKKVAKPVTEITDGLKSANGVVSEVGNFIDGLNETVYTTAELSSLCFALTEIPPPVDALFDTLGTALREFSETTKEVLTPLNEFKQGLLSKAKDVLGDILKVCGEVSTALTFFATKVPLWTNTVQVLYYGWEVVSALVGLLQGTEPAQRLEALMQKFKGIAETVKSVYDVVSLGFKDCFSVLTTVLKPICDVIEGFANWFSSISDDLKSVTHVFNDIQNVVNKVEDAIAPVKWALEAVKCIIDKVITPVVDWIMHELGLDQQVKDFVQKILHTLHLGGVMDKIDGVFSEDNLTKLDKSNTALSSSQTKASKAHELDDALKEYISDPQQVLMAAILSAVSGTPVIPGSFPPRPPRLPPIDTHHQPIFGDSWSGSVHKLPRRPALQQALIPTILSAVSGTPVIPRSLLAPAPLQLLDTRGTAGKDSWPDVTEFINDVNSTTVRFKPVVTLGGKLQAFLAKVQQQMEIPSELHTRLTQLSELATFLHDLSQFLQQFPIFKLFLPPLTASLANERQAITGLDTDVGQLVQSAASLSASIQPVMKANSPTLIATIQQLISSLNNWKSQAEKYRDQLQHGYDMDKKTGGKFRARLDALSTTYHQRIAQLHGILTQIKDLAIEAGDDGNTLAEVLEAAGKQFDKVDPYIYQLEGEIQKVSRISQIAAKLDAIFKPLQWMVHHYKCVGDYADIKAHSLKSFQLLSDLSVDPELKEDFKEIYTKLMNEFFPVQTVVILVKDGENTIQAASATVTKTSPHYLQVLQSIQKLQVGKYQYQHYNKKTGKTETIDSHFFSEAEVAKVLQLGQDLSKATQH